MYTQLCLSAAVSFFVTVLLSRIFIPVLKSIKMGQKILDIGPRWHKSKEGTPTMGGLFFIAAFSIPAIAYALLYSDITFVIHYLFILFNGAIGFLDDYTKFFKKQNKGLSASQKLVLQFACAAAYVLALRLNNSISTVVTLPFGGSQIDLGIAFYVLLIVGAVFMVNSTNLTDGIDGLCSSITAVVTVFFAVIALKSANTAGIYTSGALFGGMAGFLVYNFHPARVFMGDTGSLFIGAVITALSLMLDAPFMLVFAGIVYYMESLSVILQVTSFKLTKKRIFKMSPIHHHFEMCGWNEVKITLVFSAVAAIFALVGCYGTVVVI